MPELSEACLDAGGTPFMDWEPAESSGSSAGAGLHAVDRDGEGCGNSGRDCGDTDSDVQVPDAIYGCSVYRPCLGHGLGPLAAQTETATRLQATAGATVEADSLAD